MTDLVVDGVDYTWDGTGDFCTWAAQQLNNTFVHAEFRGEHVTTVGLNLTGRRKGHTIDFERFRLTAKDCPAIVDLTDSVGIKLLGGTFVGDPLGAPGLGVLQSRCAEEAYRSAGGHMMRGVTVVGKYSIAAIGNLGSEGNSYDHLRVQSDGSPAVILSHRNGYSFASAWLTADNQATATTASFDTIDATSKDVARAAVIVDGFDRVHLGDFTSIACAYAGLLVDCGTNAVVGPTVPDLYVRPKGVIPRCALLYRGRNGIVGHYVRGSQLLASKPPQVPIAVDDATPFFHCEWIHHETTPEQWGNAIFEASAPSRIWRRFSEEWLPDSP